MNKTSRVGAENSVTSEVCDVYGFKWLFSSHLRVEWA